MPHKIAYLCLGMTAALLCGGGYAFYSAAPNGNAATRQPAPAGVPVVAAAVQSGDVPIYLRGIGTVRPTTP